MDSGIYCITNLINGYKYIGKDSRVDKQKRWKHHIWELKNKTHDNDYLQRVWNKYGEEIFEYEIIEYCPKSILNKREIYWIKKLNTRMPNGYNMTSGGENNNPSEKTKNKISKANSGKGNGMFGKHHSKETKQKMSKAQSGENNSMFGIRRFGKDNPMFGKHVSKKIRQKMSKANSGKNNPMFGKHHSEETKQKIKDNRPDIFGENNPFFGKHHSEETKKKLSAIPHPSGENHPMFGKKHKNSSSEYYGVSKHILKRKHLRWAAKICSDGVTKYIGQYKTELDAAKAYDKYVIENNLNRPLNFPENYSKQEKND